MNHPVKVIMFSIHYNNPIKYIWSSSLFRTVRSYSSETGICIVVIRSKNLDTDVPYASNVLIAFSFFATLVIVSWISAMRWVAVDAGAQHWDGPHTFNFLIQFWFVWALFVTQMANCCCFNVYVSMTSFVPGIVVCCVGWKVSWWDGGRHWVISTDSLCPAVLVSESAVWVMVIQLPCRLLWTSANVPLIINPRRHSIRAGYNQCTCCIYQIARIFPIAILIFQSFCCHTTFCCI